MSGLNTEVTGLDATRRVEDSQEELGHPLGHVDTRHTGGQGTVSEGEVGDEVTLVRMVGTGRRHLRPDTADHGRVSALDHGGTVGGADVSARDGHGPPLVQTATIGSLSRTQMLAVEFFRL